MRFVRLPSVELPSQDATDGAGAGRLQRVRELSTIQAAGVGAPVLALAALLSLSLSVWVLRNSRNDATHRLAFRIAIAGSIVLGVFYALTLSAHGASRVGVRAWVATEHQTEQLVDLLDRATLQLTRGRAILRVATVLVWAPLTASAVALWRAGVRGQSLGSKIPSLVLMGAMALATIKLLTTGGAEPRDEAYALVVPTLTTDLQRELTPAAPEPTCKRLEGAAAIMGTAKVAAALPAAHETARACARRRFREGTPRETLQKSYLLVLAPNALDGL